MKRTFVFQEGKSQKFWSIDVKDKGFIVNFGRLGTAGQFSEKSFASDELCQKEANKLITEKTKNGYKELNEGEAMPEKEIQEQNMSEVKTALKALLERLKTRNIVEQEPYDFSNVESEVGFSLHDDLKDFYNSFYCDGKYIEGGILLDYTRPEFEYLNPVDPDDEDDYDEDDDDDDYDPRVLNVSIDKINNKVSLDERILHDHTVWKAHNWNKNGLFYIGTLSGNKDVGIIFDNFSGGKLYWYDFEYGEEEFEDVPRGFLANSLADFFNQIKK